MIRKNRLCVNVRQSKIVAHIIEKVIVVALFNHSCKGVGDSPYVNTVTLEVTGLGKETQERVGTDFCADVMERFPLGTEADDGPVDRIVLAAVDKFMAPVMVREEVEEAVTFFFHAMEILVSIGSDEEFFEARGRLRTEVRSTGRRGILGFVGHKGTDEVRNIGAGRDVDGKGLVPRIDSADVDIIDGIHKA